VKASDSESESPGPSTPDAKRRNDDVPASPHKSPHKSPAKKETITPTKSLLKKPSSPKGSKKIRFACVREYVFPRKQSFCTLPSTGGCALGMAAAHQQQLTLPMPQHRERLHSKRRKKVRHWRRKQRKISENQVASSAINASDLSTSSDSDSDAPEEDLSGVDDWWFLQSISPKKRRKILKSHISDVDSQDRLNNRGLRKERDVCGCNCQGVCYPDSCECALNDIPCQVDRDGFPCGCMAGRCGNSAGRRSFNSARVRHHFFKTMYRLRCHEQGTDTVQTSPSTNANEVPIDEPQQPFSFGDFTKPSDYAGTVFWPQQWTEPGPSSQQWSGMQQHENVSARLCNESQPSTSGNQENTSSTEESSTEGESQPASSKLDQSEIKETEQHEIDMTVNVNDEQQSNQFDESDNSDAASDKSSVSDKEDNSDRSDKMSDSDDTNQSDQSDD